MQVDEDRGERVVKMSLSRLIRNDHTFLSETIDKMVLKNSKLSWYGATVLLAIARQCTENNVDVPPLIMNQKFLYHAHNWTLIDNLHRSIYPLITEAISPPNGICSSLQSLHNDILGHGWMIGYLVKAYIASTKTSTQAKCTAFINDTISAYLSAHHSDASRTAKNQIKKEIKRRIFNPSRPAAPTAPILTNNAEDLITFHRNGFNVTGNDPLNKLIFSDESRYPSHITHFGRCLARQEALEDDNDNLQVKKRLPLPMAKIGRTSLHYDKRGIYYLVHQAIRDGHQFTRPYTLDIS